MPTRRVKSSERRRCAKACWSCKRRKERCDGCQPCHPCVRRKISDRCSFNEQPPVLDGSSSSNNNSNSNRGGADTAGGEQGRRSGQPLPIRAPLQPFPSSLPIDLIVSDNIHNHDLGSILPDDAFSQLISAGQGRIMFIGDTANFAFLYILRRLVGQSLGPCEFADDPFRHVLVEATHPSHQDWVFDKAQRPLPVPDRVEIRYLLRWYVYATNCVLNLFDEAELRDNLLRWQQIAPDKLAKHPMSPVFFLIFAIGAQTGPENRDDDAERYFNYGRLLTTRIIDQASVPNVMANVLITMYLLSASRRDAAFISLGAAVRAAVALGIHRYEINHMFTPYQFIIRERLWKILRVLDLFLSISLGRPPSTYETRDTQAETNYSASNDLCAIFETIITQAYSERSVSPEVLGRISEHHRKWAQKFSTGLAADDIRPREFLDTDHGKVIPNIGLLHLKEAYYWTIMLLTRPFLIESATVQISRSAGGSHGGYRDTAPKSPSNHILAHACVDSAIRTVDLLQSLISAEVPKRLPFVVNSVFIAALVLGLAQFADMDQAFPLEKSFATARNLLESFRPYDVVADRCLVAVDKLQAACNLYLDRRARLKMEKNSRRIGGLFGSVHANPPFSSSSSSSSLPSHTSLPAHSQDPPNLTASNRPACSPNPVFISPHGNGGGGGSGAAIPDFAQPPDLEHPLGFGGEGLEMLPDFTTMADLSIPPSPSNFLCQKFEKPHSLYSTDDSGLFAAY